MKTFERNTEAEKSAFVTIPKNTTLPCGIVSVQTFVNAVKQGDNKGREFDKYKLLLRPLQGEFKGKLTSVSVSCQCERRDGVDGVAIDNWGNSKNYIKLMRLMGHEFDDEAIPLPESKTELEEHGATFEGKVLNVTFGTFTFKSDKEDGSKITVNTCKELEDLNDDQKKALETDLAEWAAEQAAKSGGGALDLGKEYDGSQF